MSLIHFDQPRSTSEQRRYIEILAVDLTFTRQQRNAHICAIINREVKFLDEMTKEEASRVIQQFIEWKDEQQTQSCHL